MGLCMVTIRTRFAGLHNPALTLHLLNVPILATPDSDDRDKDEDSQIDSRSVTTCVTTRMDTASVVSLIGHPALC